MSESWNVLEWFFVGLLGLMVVAVSAFGAFVMVRLVEPRGMRAFLKRIARRS